MLKSSSLCNLILVGVCKCHSDFPVPIWARNRNEVICLQKTKHYWILLKAHQNLLHEKHSHDRKTEPNNQLLLGQNWSHAASYFK